MKLAAAVIICVLVLAGGAGAWWAGYSQSVMAILADADSLVQEISSPSATGDLVSEARSIKSRAVALAPVPVSSGVVRAADALEEITRLRRDAMAQIADAQKAQAEAQRLTANPVTALVNRNAANQQTQAATTASVQAMQIAAQAQDRMRVFQACEQAVREHLSITGAWSTPGC